MGLTRSLDCPVGLAPGLASLAGMSRPPLYYALFEKPTIELGRSSCVGATRYAQAVPLLQSKALL